MRNGRVASRPVSRWLPHAAVVGLALWLPTARAEPGALRVDVVGTAFHVTQADGRVLAGEALVGAVLNIRDGADRRQKIRIGAIYRDDSDPEGEVFLYELQTLNAETGEWSNACRPGPDGRAQGFPLAGKMAADGRYVPTPGTFTLSCTSGILAKCVRMGYKPWKVTASGASLLDAFRACTRMLRADYCGDGVAHTREGTAIDVYDTFGIQVADPAGTMTFEAAWDADGAVCVKKSRIPEHSVDDLLLQCPERLKGRTGEDCTPERARVLGNPLLMNSS